MLRVSTEFDKIFRPIFKGFVVRRHKLGLFIRHGGAGFHNYHISAFLNRHLHIVKQLAAGRIESVYLSRDDRVIAGIVGRKIVLPHIRGSELVYGAHHSADKLGSVKQEEGHGGVGNVHRRRRTAGIAFLGNEKKLAVFVGNKLMRRNGLAVCKREKLGVFFAACLRGIAVKLFCEGVASFAKRFKICRSFYDCFLDGLAVPCPVSLERVTEIVDGINIVIGEEEKLLLLFGHGNADTDTTAECAHNTAVGGCLLASCGEINVSPLDADNVAPSAEGLLLGSTHF